MNKVNYFYTSIAFTTIKLLIIIIHYEGYTRICCIHLTNVQHCNNCFTRDRTIQAEVIIKTPN